MEFIPPAAQPLLLSFTRAFTQPTFQRWLLLVVGAIFTPGRHTISNLLRTVQPLFTGHASSYHRLFSQRRWSRWPLGRALASYILGQWIPDGPVAVAGDDTVDGHPGRQVYGKGRHRDPVRSSHTFTAWRWGHKWIVVAFLVSFPFAQRPWALPVLVALYHSETWNRQHGRRHKTPVVLMRQLLLLLIRWFPTRHFCVAGDGGYGSHELAAFVHKHRRHLTLISRFYADANLYQPPPIMRGKRRAGRPRQKGAKRPAPQAVVAAAKRRSLRVRWYGGSQRRVAVVSGTGLWYRSGQGVVPIRWVFVHDQTGTHRDEYFFTTDVRLTPRQLIEAYTGRWSIETTFQELRAYLGLETTRGRKAATVLRAAPCLFGLFSVVALLYAQLPATSTAGPGVLWVGKHEVTFSDAMTAMRRWVWVEWVFVTCGYREAFRKLPFTFQQLLLTAVAPAA